MTTDARAKASSTGPQWLTIAVAVFFGLFFAYDLIEAITNLVGVPAELSARNEFRADQDLAVIPVPWSVLVANTLLPLVAFGAAWWVGRRRSPGSQAVVYLVALAVVAAYTLTFTALL